MTDPFEADLGDLLERRSRAAAPAADARRRIDAKIRARARRQRVLAGVGVLAVLVLVGAGVAWQRAGDDGASTVDITDEPTPRGPQVEHVEAATELSYQLGREEILSVALLGEGGEAFEAQLAEQRAATDEAATALLPLVQGASRDPATPRRDCGYATAPGATGPTPDLDCGGVATEQRIEDLATIRLGIDGRALPWVSLIDQYAQTRVAVIDDARASAATVDDVALYRRLDQALWFADGTGDVSDAAAAVAVALGLPPDERAAHGTSDPDTECMAWGLGGPCAAPSVEHHAAEARAAFDEWTRRASSTAASALSDQLATLDLLEILDAIRATATAPVDVEPLRGLNATWVPRALGALDGLQALQRSSWSETPPVAEVDPRSALTAEEVSSVAVDLLTALGELGMAPGPVARLREVADGGAALSDLSDLSGRAVAEGAPQPVVDAFEAVEAAFDEGDADLVSTYAARLDALVALIDASGLLAGDAPTFLAVDQVGRLADGYAGLALQQALLTSVITAGGGRWGTGDFDLFLESGTDGDRSIARWEDRASPEQKTIYRNELATREVRTADDIVAAAVDGGPTATVDVAPEPWLDGGLAKLEAFERVLAAQLDEIPA